MKFVFTSSRTVTWPVEVSVPVDGGKHQVQTFDATFEILPQDEYDAIVQKDIAAADKAVLMRVVQGWTITAGEGDAAGPLPCTDDNKEKVFAVPYIRAGAMLAYLRAATGGRVKN